MREIKFRVWDKELKQFNSPNVHHLEKNNGILNIVLNSDIQKISGNDRFTIQQYTGLKDKNDVEIYEGDIIKYRDGSHTAAYYDKVIVEWRDEVDDSYDYTGWKIQDSFLQGGISEVVGNIFENPELLKR